MLTKLIAFLEAAADAAVGPRLIFLQKDSLVITTKHNEDGIPEADDINKFLNFLENNDRKFEVRTMFVSELINFLKDVAVEDDRFAKFLHHFRDFRDAFDKSYCLYLEGYSFHKVKAELDKQLLDLSDKIQSIINDAQNKLVTIPAAFVLILTQFDFTGKKIAFNICLLIAALLFSYLLQILISNQKESLSFVKDSIARFKVDIDAEKTEILQGELKEAFDKVDGRRKKQGQYLVRLQLLIWLVPAFVLVLILLTIFTNLFSFLLFQFMSVRSPFD